MPTYTAKVTPENTIPVPPEMVKALGIKPGEEVEFFLTLDGQVHFHVLRESFDAPFGIRHVPPVSIREMDDAIGEAVYESDLRTMSHQKILSNPAAE